MIEEGVITGIDARPGTAGRGGQAGLARGLRRPAATDLPRTPDWPSGACRTLRLAFRGPAMPSAVRPRRRLLTGTGYTPGPPPGTDTVHGAPGPGHPPPARRRPPCHTDRAAASRSPSHRRLTAQPHADAGEPAHQQHGGITARASRPGTGSANARQAASALHARPPYGPGHHRHQRTARPGAGRDARPAQRRPSSYGRAAAAARPWPSVESRRCTPTVLAAGRRRYVSVDTATQGPTALQGDTRWDKKETARIAENSQLSGRFRRWWQVLGSNQRRLSRRFYSSAPIRTISPLTCVNAAVQHSRHRRCPLYVRAHGHPGGPSHGQPRTLSRNRLTCANQQAELCAPNRIQPARKCAGARQTNTTHRRRCAAGTPAVGGPGPRASAGGCAGR